MQRFFARTSLAVATAAILLLAACGGSSTATATKNTTGVLDPNKQYAISFWEAFATGANKTTLEQLTSDYMAKHPNVKVTLQAYPDYNTLDTKLTAAIAAGAPPAISQIYENWATQFQQANALASLQPFISGPNGLAQSDLSDFYPKLLQDGQINNTQYMLPFNKSDIVMYYNADMLQKLGLTVPTTWSDFATDLQKATAADGSTWGMSYTPSSSVDDWSYLYKAFGGGNFISADGKTAEFGNATNAPIAKAAMDQWIPLVKSGAIHITQGFNWQNDLISQKSLFAVSSIASYPFLAKPIGTTFNLQEAPLPAGPSGQYTVFFGTNLAIYSGVSADQQAAAWDYMKYLTSTDAQATFVQGTGYMPVRQSTYNSTTLQSYYSQVPARKVGPQSLSFAFVASIVPAWNTCRNVISTDFASALNGQLTSDQAVQKMTADCNAALAQG